MSRVEVGLDKVVQTVLHYFTEQSKPFAYIGPHL
jgi:hypothetical protein